ncbi:MAG: TolC family protein [Oligoflexia bacterium]|nr:TolC family protein [Oligoflexia bacterium]
MLELVRLKENFKLSKELLRLEEKNAEMLEREYRSGHVPYLDLTDGLKKLLDARVGHTNDSYSLKQWLYTYLFYQGRIYEYILGGDKA